MQPFAQSIALNAQPKTTTNNVLNPKDALNIHSPHHRYHIGFPHN